VSNVVSIESTKPLKHTQNYLVTKNCFIFRLSSFLIMNNLDLNPLYVLEKLNYLCLDMKKLRSAMPRLRHSEDDTSLTGMKCETQAGCHRWFAAWWQISRRKKERQCKQVFLRREWETMLGKYKITAVLTWDSKLRKLGGELIFKEWASREGQIPNIVTSDSLWKKLTACLEFWVIYNLLCMPICQIDFGHL
jgi:hypothetical protein